MNDKLNRGHGRALVVIAIITLVYLWPLVRQFTTAIPGTANDHDVATMVWNVGWVHESLSGGRDLFYTDMVLLPFGADLRLHTYGLLQGLLAYPVTALFGVIAGFNLGLLLTMFLNGAVTYILILGEIEPTNNARPSAGVENDVQLRLLRLKLSALVAAVCTMLGTPLLSQLAVGRPAFGSLWIVAGAMIALRSLLDQPRVWKAAALGGLLVMALLSDFQILLFAALWLTLYGLYRLLRDHQKLLTRTHIMASGLAGIIALVPFLLIYYPSLAHAGYIRPRLQDMTLFSFRYWDYVTPGVMNQVYGYELFVAAFIGVGVFRGRGNYRFWLVGALTMLVLALGPMLQTPNGVTEVRLPFALLSSWSPLSNFRTPYRLAIPALMGLGVAAGFVLMHFSAKIESRRVLIVAAAVAVGGRLALATVENPMQTQVYHDYTIYHQIAAEAGDFTVLEVPFGVRSGLDRIGQVGDILQYYQHVHGKRLFNAMVARLPVEVFQFYRQSPALLFLSGEPAAVNPLRLQENFTNIVRWSNTRYVIVHFSLLDSTQAARIEAFLDQQPILERLTAEDDLRIYRIKTDAMSEHRRTGWPLNQSRLRGGSWTNECSSRRRSACC